MGHNHKANGAAGQPSGAGLGDNVGTLRAFFFMAWQLVKAAGGLAVWVLEMALNAWVFLLCGLVGFIGLTVAFFGTLIFFNIVLGAVNMAHF